MSDTEPASTAEPRRSQRERRQAKPFQSTQAVGRKRKRGASATDGETDDGEATERAVRSAAESNDEHSDSDADNADEDEDEDERFKAPAKSRRKSTAATKPRKSIPSAKKPRTAHAGKSAGAAEKGAKRIPKPRARKVTKDGQNTEELAKESKVGTDNHLFNAILNPAAALQSTVEDFLESLQQTPGPALAELVNCILRCCGCNDSVDEDTVVDYDGVVDSLDNFTEGLKQEDSPVYPLTSKLPVFKKFRKSLNEFLQRLVVSSAELGSLYTSDLMVTLQTWVIAMSSSQLRSFRHTASAVALEMATALCGVAASVEKEAVTVSRQREGERKRKGAASASNARDKDLERKAAEVRERRSKLSEYLKEFVDGVFVHRYRDFDPSIRTECISAMGSWFSRYPSHFLDGAYLRYVGWVLSDANVGVRVAAVRALSAAYAQTEHISAMSHFTERFKPRLVEMARADAELSVRVAVCGVLAVVDGHGLLDDEQRGELCLLVFDEEPRVRRAVAGFVKGVWEDAVNERLVGREEPTEQERKRVGVKALATLLVGWGTTLDADTGEKDSDSGSEAMNGTSSQGARRSAPDRATILTTGAAEQRGRVALAVEALWEEVDAVNDWKALIDILLLDHSAQTMEDDGERPVTITKGRGRKNGKPTLSSAGRVDDAWRLEEVEEGVLLEVLVGILRKEMADAAAAKKQDDDESPAADVTRELIKALPTLFAKHQTDPSRIANVLLIPKMMNLDIYLQMRMIPAYSNLWDDVTKQFLHYSTPAVLTASVGAILHMLRAISLQTTNTTKMQELEDKLGESLRSAVANASRDGISSATLTADDVVTITAICARLATLTSLRDLTTWTEENEGGKQTSVWDIVLAIADRGRFGYQPEEKMVEHAIRFLTAHIMWKTKNLASTPELLAEESVEREKFREQRDSLLSKARAYALGAQYNTIEGVKRAAFQSLMTIHVLFAPSDALYEHGVSLPTASMSLHLDEEAQQNCAGFIQAEVERFAEELEEHATGADSDDSSSLSELSGDEEPQKKAKEKATDRARGKGEKRPSRAHLQQEYTFISLVSSYLQAVCTGVIDVRHGAILLVHYGRLGPAYDACTRAFIDVLRDEGMYQGHGAIVADVIVHAMRQAFTLVLDKIIRTEDYAVGLAKTLVSCLLVRGAQLAVVRKLDSEHVMAIHTTLVSWIAKRIGTYESNGNKGLKNIALLFFRVLVPLLATVDSRDALGIKAHADQALAQAKVEPSPTAKAWEAFRAYEKRLSTAMSRDKGSKSKKGGRKNARNAATDDSADEGQETADDIQPSKPVPRARPRRKASNRSGLRNGATDAEDADASSEPDQDPLVDQSLQDLPPERRTTRYKRRPSLPASSPASSPPLATPEPENTVSENNGEDDSITTPKASRKRTRDEDGDPNAEASAMEEDAPPSPAGSQASRFSEVVIKRKRARL